MLVRIMKICSLKKADFPSEYSSTSSHHFKTPLGNFPVFLPLGLLKHKFLLVCDKMEQIKSNVKLTWSYYYLPGFVPAPDGYGYVPEEEYDRINNASQSEGRQGFTGLAKHAAKPEANEV